VVDTLPCERVALDSGGRWTTWHIGAAVARTSDGNLYAVLGGDPTVALVSTDGGRTWTDWNVELPRGLAGALTALADDSLLGAAERTFYRSTDRGQSWEQTSELPLGPFDSVFVGGNLLGLRDGAILVPVEYRVSEAEGTNVLTQGLYAVYGIRSTDGGRTWQNGPDMGFWRTVKEARLNVVSIDKDGRAPGPGGIFHGCYEIGIEQLADGTILAALRYSGAPEPWHTPALVRAWRGGEPDALGRMFKNVLLGDSPDGGCTWQNLRPVVDAQGNTLLPRYDTSAELVQMPCGRLVMVIVRRGPYGQCQLIGKVSTDSGRTWLPEEYRLTAGFGYSSSVALPDGTIVTVTGKTLPKDGVRMRDRPFGAEVIRWRLR